MLRQIDESRQATIRDLKETESILAPEIRLMKSNVIEMARLQNQFERLKGEESTMKAK